MYGTLLAGFYLAVFLSYFTTVKEVAGYYVRILCVLAVYSLVATYLLRRLPDAGLLAVPQMINTKGNGYYNFGLCYVSITHVAYRNFGMFREPGVYQFFLMVGLYLNNYWVEWKKESHMWLAPSRFGSGGFWVRQFSNTDSLSYGRLSRVSPWGVVL